MCCVFAFRLGVYILPSYWPGLYNHIRKLLVYYIQ